MSIKSIYTTVDRHIKVFTKTKEKVFTKFLVDMIFGILMSSSINLSSISRQLEKRLDTTPRHIFKRINRNIGKFDTEKIKSAVQLKQIRMIDENTLIYFDPTEIVKEHGKKFEALSWVADGSDNHKLKPGYPMIACTALRGNELIPIDMSLFSYCSEDFESANQSYLYAIDTIAHQSKFKGIFVLDRGFDAFAVIRHLMLNSINFIIRMDEKRKYYPWGDYTKSYTRHEIINSHTKVKAKVFLDIKVDKKLKKRLFNVRAVPVELLGGKIDDPRKMTLIRAKSKKLTLYLLTNLEDITVESIVNVVQHYLNRWKVEEFIRFVKQQYKLEKIKVLSLGRIKNLINCLFMATVILARTGELKMNFSKTRALIIKYAKRTYKLPQKMKFFLYSLADGLAQILATCTKKVVQLFYPIPKKQLPLSFREVL